LPIKNDGANDPLPKRVLKEKREFLRKKFKEAKASKPMGRYKTCTPHGGQYDWM
jgi:hypothetical protein